MLLLERVQIITDYLKEHNYATVKQIAKDIHMSETTVRRDLNYLENQNVVKRNYGGAMLVSHLHQTVPFDLRVHENEREKDIIAQKAVSLIKAGDTVYLDESSTTCALIEYLDPKSNITVVTSSLIATIFLSRKNICTYCTGGLFNPVTSSFQNRYTEEFFSKFNANIAFFSATCVSESGRITNSLENNVYIKQSILANAETTVFLCDHTKFDKTSLATVCTLSDVDCAVSDVPWPDHLKRLIKFAL